MASFIVKFITKKILKERVQNNFGTEDPYFETVPATRLDGKPTDKVKKRPKALPPGVSKHDGKVLTKVKRRAWRLDMCLFSLCGVRFGWGSAIGLIPAIGDAIDALMALMVFRTCCKVEGGLPQGVKTKMIFNIIVDFALGLVPFVGDMFDAAFRCNTKNAVLLESYLREKGRKNLRQSGVPIPEIDPSDSVIFDQRRRDDPDSDGSVHVDRQPQRNGTMSSRPDGTRRHDRTAEPTVPANAKVRDTGRSGWFNFGRGRATDLEAGGDNTADRSTVPTRHQSNNERRREI
ncbi:hypothetical protein VD0002_g5528 [Verticillium dahliae]|uniref:PH domain-containing protein n=2 Tax=Verticillium dahliae TaxID=27337 RepID=G2X908_VERDV|nr:uncharacterized protein VDAG_06640 [Verticillium dahliae VdLs.17]KAF3342695.1 Exosome complex component RRP42 [Verticillium dahliae VDG2]KAF3353260.1 hypothetical protein VdG1_04619 [Verticillium dahliae VDG1]KAH6687545.1 hypothetical protein EV126DRAFT_128645 [Verticillium dahliae]EGY15476.1 hypothetical protein VDAG_06640 [Verticillium dahliae VdLs.17]PNH36053.1 hypothetical protein BJF96_g1040 [Verticillium dahliae]